MTTHHLKGKGGRFRKRSMVFDSEEEELPSKKTCNESNLSELKDDVVQVDTKVEHCLESIESSLDDVLNFSKGTKVPLWLIRLFRDSLKCRICLSVPIT